MVEGDLGDRAHSGFTMFVASSRPPMPTSSNREVHGFPREDIKRHGRHALKERGVRGSSPVESIFSISVPKREKAAANSASPISAPLRRMRSLMRSRCGDVYSPVR